jgi:hypothetical protein
MSVVACCRPRYLGAILGVGPFRMRRVSRFARRDVTQLDELAKYSLAWLASPFMARPVAEVALDRLAVALAPNGHLVVGLFAVPTDEAGAAFTALRIVRSGGHVWDVADMEQQLVVRGFVEVETCLIPPTCFVIGRRL